MRVLILVTDTMLQKWRPRNRSPSFWSAAARTHFSWVTVRHPLERLLSAYRDKFFLNGKAKYEQEKVERLYKRFGRKIIEKYRTGQLSVLTFIFKVLPILNKK